MKNAQVRESPVFIAAAEQLIKAMVGAPASFCGSSTTKSERISRLGTHERKDLAYRIHYILGILTRLQPRADSLQLLICQSCCFGG